MRAGKKWATEYVNGWTPETAEVGLGALPPWHIHCVLVRSPYLAPVYCSIWFESIVGASHKTCCWITSHGVVSEWQLEINQPPHPATTDSANHRGICWSLIDEVRGRPVGEGQIWNTDMPASFFSEMLPLPGGWCHPGLLQQRLLLPIPLPVCHWHR
jgi:hypothetical protein